MSQEAQTLDLLQIHFYVHVFFMVQSTYQDKTLHRIHLSHTDNAEVGIH